MTEIAEWLRANVPPDVDLDRPTLSRLVGELAQAEHLWRPFVRHDREARFYQQLYRDPNLDIWLICWVYGQSTGYHDHDRSCVAVKVCEGTLYEDWFRIEEDGWVRERTTVHEAGGGFDFDSADIHGFAPGLDPAKIEVNIDRGVLTVEGERASALQPAEEKSAVHINERFAGRFRRVVSLPDDADPTAVSAEYRDGVLHLSIKRRESALPPRIEVK